MKAFWRMLGDVWGEFRNDPEEVIDAGHKIVVSKNRDPPSATLPPADRVSVLTSDKGGSGARSRR